MRKGRNNRSQSDDIVQEPGNNKNENPGDQRNHGSKTQGDTHEGAFSFQSFFDSTAKARTHPPPPISSQPMMGGNDVRPSGGGVNNIYTENASASVRDRT